MRFAPEGDSTQVFTTKIVDISTTGVSFVVPREQAPFIFDKIKVEIPLDGGEQIAWWGKTVRVEEYSRLKWYLKKDDFYEDQVLVAIRFEDLPEGHVARIRKTLDKKFTEIEAEKRAEARKNWALMWVNHTWEMVFYVAVVLLGFYVLWALAQPSENYDAEKGSPWGQRMWHLDPSKWSQEK
jgi:hypothetical protein